MLSGAGAGVEVTVFADGLSFPVGMARLADGSLLVTESPSPGGFFSGGTGRLVRLVDTDDDGVAEARQTVAEAVPGGSLSAVRVFGDLVAVVSVGRDVTVYRLGSGLAAPLAEVGRLTFTYPGSWQHRHSALAVREAPGEPGAFDLLFQVGSKENNARTTATVALASTVGFSAALEADAVHLLRVRPTATAFEVTAHTVVARGLRNAASLAFHPVTADLYVADNGIDGLVNAAEPFSADVLHVVPAADVGVTAPDFGFPDRYIAYRTGEAVGGGPAPLMAFQPIPDPQTGDEAEGANDMAFAPASFPAALRGRLIVGFHGRFGSGGSANEENPLVLVNPADGAYRHLIGVRDAAVGHLDGVLASGDDLFLADLSPAGPVDARGLGTGRVYRLRARHTAQLAGADGWRMLALPGGGAVGDLVGGLWTQGYPGASSATGGLSVHLYREADAAYGAPASQAEPLPAGRGAFVYVYADDDPTQPGLQGGFPKPLAAAAPPAEAPFTFSGLTQTEGSAAPGWHLLGNPFGEALDWDVPGWTRADLSEAAYVYDPTEALYRVRSGGIGNLTDGLIPAFQGFWVRATGASAVLVAPPEARVSGGPLYGRPTPTEVLALHLEGPLGRPDLAVRSSDAFVAFRADASAGLDAYDADALVPPAPAYALLWSLPASGPESTPLAIQALPLLEAPVTLAVGALGVADGGVAEGTYRLSWPTLPPAMRLVLTDNETGVTTDLSGASEYAFTLSAAETSAGAPLSDRGPASPGRPATPEARFQLRFDRLPTASAPPPLVGPATLGPAMPSPTRGLARLMLTLPAPSDVRIEVIDALGRTVRRIVDGPQPAGTHSIAIDTQDLPTGLYLVRARTGGTVATRPLVVVR